MFAQFMKKQKKPAPKISIKLRGPYQYLTDSDDDNNVSSATSDDSDFLPRRTKKNTSASKTLIKQTGPFQYLEDINDYTYGLSSNSSDSDFQPVRKKQKQIKSNPLRKNKKMSPKNSKKNKTIALTSAEVDYNKLCGDDVWHLKSANRFDDEEYISESEESISSDQSNGYSEEKKTKQKLMESLSNTNNLLADNRILKVFEDYLPTDVFISKENFKKNDNKGLPDRTYIYIKNVLHTFASTNNNYDKIHFSERLLKMTLQSDNYQSVNKCIEAEINSDTGITSYVITNRAKLRKLLRKTTNVTNLVSLVIMKFYSPTTNLFLFCQAQ